MVSLYRVQLTKQAKTDLTRLDRVMAQRVLNRIRWLADNFDTVTPQPLAGKWQEYSKLRAGDYRIIYRVERAEPVTLIIEFIRHRREVYK